MSNQEEMQPFQSSNHKPGIFRRFAMRRKHAWRQKRMAKLTQKLTLDSLQEQQLEQVFQQFGAIRHTAKSSKSLCTDTLLEAMQNESFDSDKARQSTSQALQDIQEKANESIDAFARWFDLLSLQQQEQLRLFAQHRFGAVSQTHNA